jgi:hypothetical protein
MHPLYGFFLNKDDRPTKLLWICDNFEPGPMIFMVRSLERQIFLDVLSSYKSPILLPIIVPLMQKETIKIDE